MGILIPLLHCNLYFAQRRESEWTANWRPVSFPYVSMPMRNSRNSHIFSCAPQLGMLTVSGLFQWRIYNCSCMTGQTFWSAELPYHLHELCHQRASTAIDAVCFVNLSEAMHLNEQRRQSGLKSGGSWIRVKKNLISPREISEKFWFLVAIFKKFN